VAFCLDRGAAETTRSSPLNQCDKGGRPVTREYILAKQNANSVSEASLSFKLKHLPELDGLRAIAVLMVMMCHFKLATPYRLWHVFDQGGFGVYLFFVLSGFLITRILISQKDKPHYFRNFYARRTLRIFPLYYGVLAITFWLLVPLFPSPTISADARYQGWLWGYAYNILVAIKGRYFFSSGWMGLGHFWSLAVEEQFYLAWPFIVMFVSRKTLKTICVSIIALTPLVRMAFFLSEANIYWVVMFTLCQLDSLAWGALLAVLEKSGKLTRLRRPAVITMIGVGSLLAVASLHWPKSPETGFPLVAYHSGIAILFAAVILLAQGGSFGWLNGAIFREIGQKSYAMYVFHVPLLFLARDLDVVSYLRHKLRYPIPADVLFFLIMIATTYALAFLSYHAYEKHFLKLKRFFGTSNYDVPNERPLDTTPSGSNPDWTLVPVEAVSKPTTEQT